MEWPRGRNLKKVEVPGLDLGLTGTGAYDEELGLGNCNLKSKVVECVVGALESQVPNFPTQDPAPNYDNLKKEC